VAVSRATDHRLPTGAPLLSARKKLDAAKVEGTRGMISAKRLLPWIGGELSPWTWCATTSTACVS